MLLMNKPVVHFSHANGLPSSTYSYLFEQLAQHFELNFIERMGYEGSNLSGNWYDLADELINSIEQGQAKRDGNHPVIGMGHSAGAVVTLIAASKRPELFSHVVLLDPVLFSRRKRFMMGALRSLGLMDRMGLVKQARARRSRFATVKEAREYFRPKGLFKDFHPRCFEDYVQHALKPNQQGFELAIAPEHEAQIFRSVIAKAPNAMHKVKGTLIYGSKSDAVDKSDVRWWHKNLPKMTVKAFDGAHLFPLEQPDKVLPILIDALNAN